MANNIDFNVSTNAVTVLNQTAGAAENTAKGFTSAKAELRALNNQLQQMDQTSEAFKKASERAAELKDSIGDLSAEISANAGNAFEGVSNNVSLFGSRLMSLDLKGAGQALTAVGAASKKIGFKEMATELGGLTKGILNLGKALLTNPLFLLGSVIAVIVTNFESLSKSGGVLGSILTKIGDLIDWAIQGFQDLTDAIGLTSIAAQKEAEKVAQVAKDIRDEIDKIDKIASDRKKKVLEEFNNDINKAYDAEKKRIDEILKDNERQMKSYEDLYNSGKVLNESQQAMYEYFKTESTKFKAYIKDFGKEVDDYNEKKRKEAADKLKKEQDEKERLQKEADDKELERRKKLNDDMMAEDERMALIDLNDLIEREKKKSDAKLLGEMQYHANLTALQAEQSQKELETSQKLEEQKKQQRIQLAEQGFSALSALGDAYFSSQLANVQAGSKAELDLKKKQFAFNKKMQIGGAIMDTAKAITAAIAANPFPSPTLPVSIALASITGAAQIAKIASTKFDGGGGGGGGGVNIPTTGGDGTTAPSPANFDFLQNQPNQQPPLQAYVVGTQVSSNLEAQQLIQNQSRLGG